MFYNFSVIDLIVNSPIINKSNECGENDTSVSILSKTFNNRINKRSLSGSECFMALSKCISNFYDKLEKEIEFQSKTLCELSKQAQNCFSQVQKSSTCSKKFDFENFKLLFQSPCDAGKKKIIYIRYK